MTARGRTYDPMEVGIARAVHFADTKEELEAAQIRRPDKQLQVIESKHDDSIIKKILKDPVLLAGFISPINSQTLASLHLPHGDAS